MVRAGRVAGMDLGGFYGAYRRDGVGRRAYDPAMVVALLLYGYSRGVRSARAIERACREDVAFKMIAMSRRRITRRSPGLSRGTRGAGGAVRSGAGAVR